MDRSRWGDRPTLHHPEEDKTQCKLTGSVQGWIDEVLREGNQRKADQKLTTAK